MKSYINAIGTANPINTTPQLEIAGFMANALKMDEAERHRLNILYRASGIKERSSVLKDYSAQQGDYEFYPNAEELEPFPTVSSRMQIYQDHALGLSLQAIDATLAKIPAFNRNDITHIITVSCTGFYAPGIDIEIIESLKLPQNIQRTAINFMGCYAAFNAIKSGDAICKAYPDAKVLIVCVELCSIHFQKQKDDDTILANALFGDGAASFIMSAEPIGGLSLSVEKFYCDLAFEGKQEMAWHIGDHGFEMKLSAYVPEIIKSGIKQLTDNLLKELDIEREDIDLFAIHPGGKKILETIEETLGLSKLDNFHAYEVLRNHGNMSSPTIMFVLESLCNTLKESDNGKNILSFAFGPGLTLESMILRVNIIS